MTDLDPKVSAHNLDDVRVIKMCLESFQLLSGAHRILDGKAKADNLGMYKLGKAHESHPSTLWTIQNSANYIWLFRHAFWLCKEYTYRYGKVHLSERKLLETLSKLPTNISFSKEITQINCAMPDTYKVKNDGVKSYRNYMSAEKNQAKGKQVTHYGKPYSYSELWS